MGAIERFLERFGYTKLDRFGLVKTPEGRILSTRPAVLNDGLNGKIVGWTEDDLAAMELERWGEAPKAPVKTVAGKKIVARAKTASSPPPLPGVAPAAPVIAAPPAPVAAQPPVVPAQPSQPVAAKAAPVVIPTSSAVILPTPAVEEQPPVEEDEWEWEIAMARARAVAADTAATPMAFTKPAPRKAETLPAWPKTEEIERFRDEWTEVSDQKPRVMSPLEKKLAVARSTPSGGTKVPLVRGSAASPPRLPEPTPGPVPQVRQTVIPVPTLPTARSSDLRPAFSTAQAPRSSAQPPRRTARGSASLEDTVQTLAAPPAPANDATSPYVTLPSEVKPVGYAHTKRVAAKQR